RIELITSRLPSIPDTPALYYRDGIGMDDNIHLGARAGVRTPRQRSIDTNRGAAPTDPAPLLLPPLTQPLCSYQTVNVESQHHDPHSVLNWARRMLEVRSRYHAFGRGDLVFLYPRNRRILAYLRQHGDEVLLCVANLARTSQAVELELPMFDGKVPVEIFGGTA